jgi:hypothetical protein
MTRLIRQHLPCFISAIIFGLILAAGLIWAAERKAHRTQYPVVAPHVPTFMANDTDPVEVQIAAHPGRQLRTSRTNAQWLGLHQVDRARISELEGKLARVGESASAH